MLHLFGFLSLNSLHLNLALLLCWFRSQAQGKHITLSGRGWGELGSSCRISGEKGKRRISLQIFLKCFSQRHCWHFGSWNSYLGFNRCTFPGCHRNILKFDLQFIKLNNTSIPTKYKRLKRANHANNVSFLSSYLLDNSPPSYRYPLTFTHSCEIV